MKAKSSLEDEVDSNSERVDGDRDDNALLPKDILLNSIEDSPARDIQGFSTHFKFKKIENIEISA